METLFLSLAKRKNLDLILIGPKNRRYCLQLAVVLHHRSTVLLLHVDIVLPGTRDVADVVPTSAGHLAIKPL